MSVIIKKINRKSYWSFIIFPACIILIALIVTYFVIHTNSANTQSHFYDNVQVVYGSPDNIPKDVLSYSSHFNQYNYSVVKAKSTDITPEKLEDWCFSCAMHYDWNDVPFSYILYTDKNCKYGICAIKAGSVTYGKVYQNVEFNQTEDGYYFSQCENQKDNADVKIYYANQQDGKLIQKK